MSNYKNDDVPGCEYRIADLAEREARIRHAFLPEGIEYDSKEYWQYLRSQIKQERARDCAQMTAMFFEEVRAEIQNEHLGWGERERKVEFVKRMYGPTLAEGFRRDLEKKLNGNPD